MSDFIRTQDNLWQDQSPEDTTMAFDPNATADQLNPEDVARIVATITAACGYMSKVIEAPTADEAMQWSGALPNEEAQTIIDGLVMIDHNVRRLLYGMLLQHGSDEEKAQVNRRLSSERFMNLLQDLMRGSGEETGPETAGFTAAPDTNIH